MSALGSCLIQFNFDTSLEQMCIYNSLKNAMMGIETSNFEFPLLTSGDHVVEVLLNATTRRDAQDNVIGVVGIGMLTYVIAFNIDLSLTLIACQNNRPRYH